MAKAMLDRGRLGAEILIRQAVDEMLDLNGQVLSRGGGFRVGNYDMKSLASFIRTGRPDSMRICGLRLINKTGKVTSLEIDLMNIEANDLTVAATIGVKAQLWATPVKMQVLQGEAISTLHFELPEEVVDRETTIFFHCVYTALVRISEDIELSSLIPPPPPPPEEKQEPELAKPGARGTRR